jgi:hypothetical protein
MSSKSLKKKMCLGRDLEEYVIDQVTFYPDEELPNIPLPLFMICNIIQVFKIKEESKPIFKKRNFPKRRKSRKSRKVVMPV